MASDKIGRTTAAMKKTKVSQILHTYSESLSLDVQVQPMRREVFLVQDYRCFSWSKVSFYTPAN